MAKNLSSSINFLEARLISSTFYDISLQFAFNVSKKKEDINCTSICDQHYRDFIELILLVFVGHSTKTEETT